MNNANINPPPQKSGDQVVTTEQIGKNGHSKPGADIFAAQVTWDII